MSRPIYVRGVVQLKCNPMHVRHNFGAGVPLSRVYEGVYSLTGIKFFPVHLPREKFNIALRKNRGKIVFYLDDR